MTDNNIKRFLEILIEVEDESEAVMIAESFGVLPNNGRAWYHNHLGDGDVECKVL